MRQKHTPAALLFALSTCCLAAPAAASSGVAKLHINLRASPDLGSRIVAALDQGDAIEILETRGEFVRVRKQSGSVGYVKRKYLRLADADAAPTAAAPAAAATPVPSPAASAPAAAPVAPSAPVLPAVQNEPHELAPPPPAPVAVPSVAAPRRAWYVYGMAGVGFATDSPYRIQRALDTAGGSIDLKELNLSVPAFELAGGYSITPHFSAELGLLDLGAYQGILRGSATDELRLRQVLSDHYPGGGLGTAFSLGAQVSAGLWTFGGRAGGFCNFDSEHGFAYAGGTLKVETEACAPLLAARVSNTLTPRLAVGLGANAVFFDNRQFTLGVTLQYR